MARAGTQRTRSQNTQPQASQSRQPRGSQRPRQPSRHGRQEEDEPEEDEEEEEEEEEEGDDMDVDADLRKGDADGDLLRKANDLVRLALFNEHKRTPLRRDEISKKVMGSNGRAFTRVFQLAQEILGKTFGMELVELRSRAELEKGAAPSGGGGGDELDEVQKATTVKKKSAAAGSKTYILRSTLHPVIIDCAAQTYPEILEAETADMVLEDVDDDEDTPALRVHGSIIAWNTGDDLGPTGILYVILALILINGRVLGDTELRAYLKRLKIPVSHGNVHFSAKSTHQSMTVDAYLSQLIRQGYIDRRKVGESKKGKGKSKRGRVAQDDDSGVTYEWCWGNRAQSEVGEKGIAQFIAKFMAGEDEDDEEDEDAPRARHRQPKGPSKFDRMVTGIERAAGGDLNDVK
ncbi:hypothetical protein PC9H_002375 [Pleurotus ostreatus]|uniref:MAGE domain-containing protein n=1 Tax=Pleurotus ostreatus TaxID=5322 RepID=A0A8H7DN94_PLEOS|nr:uncharacterized protein PC9H_002375 [Pleurotus ostreatus]KAF7416115.1 hypothetical protein PC9H_002375 [Pleurotus ostreatus]KAJ8688931.1 hypothetical protein PTI98_013002 [Pleurotus ostreatus]